MRMVERYYCFIACWSLYVLQASH